MQVQEDFKTRGRSRHQGQLRNFWEFKADQASTKFLINSKRNLHRKTEKNLQM
jgi:hypothetical protein